MALPQEVIDAEVSLMQKCVITWKILKVELWQKQWWCFQEINVILKWENWYYSLNSHIVIDDCTYDVFYEKFDKNFVSQTWKEFTLLVNSENNTIISKEKYDLAKYPNTETCKPNLSIQDYYKNEIFNSYNIIYYIWIFVIFILIVLALLFKKYEK